MLLLILLMIAIYNIMVSSARFTSFLLIIFVLLPLRFSTTAHTLHQVDKRLVFGTGRMLETARSSVTVSVEHIYQGVPTFGESNNKMRRHGRKMMSRGSTTTKAEDRCINGKCNNKEELMADGFIPLNADYYVPRPHPPKNN